LVFFGKLYTGNGGITEKRIMRNEVEITVKIFDHAYHTRISVWKMCVCTKNINKG